VANHANLSRRSFLSRAATATGALLAAPWFNLSARPAPRTVMADEQAPWFDAPIATLRALTSSGQMTCVELTSAYLDRINRLNPLLRAVIETNPEALAIASRLDAERGTRRARSPLYGIPILLKDNIAAAGPMETTAGSLALVGSRVPGDAPLVTRLRAAGAIILGKANLSEWANFRGWAWSDGWSARGGLTQNPYDLGWTPGGSSSGCGVAVSASLCAAAIGTETDGSILSPATHNLIVGLKPSLRLVSQEGIIPISRNQDTAGPMGRTVTDVATLLGAMQNPQGLTTRKTIPTDYTVFLRRGALRGARIGVDRRFFTLSYIGPWAAVAEQAIETMRRLGAIIIDPVTTGNPWSYGPLEYQALLCEFKVHMAQYLATLSNTSMRTLADLIAFNEAHCAEEMRYFGQEDFLNAEATSGDLNDPQYLNARLTCMDLARRQGINAAMDYYGLDAIVAPGYTCAGSLAAVAGYPSLSLPVGFTQEGLPASLVFYAGYLQEPALLALAYDLEQELQIRRPPAFMGQPAQWPEMGDCGAKSVAAAPRHVLWNTISHLPGRP